MTKNQRAFLTLILSLTFSFGIGRVANGMHIMEGYLSPGFSIAWSVLCIPFLIFGLNSIKNILKKHRKTLIILAMVGAYSFVLSALKIPSVTGSSSHATGTGLGAILFGPSTMGVIGIIVLLFQALLLAHGGITTLGANTFSMAIAGPFLTFGVYKLSRRLKLSKGISVFLGASLGNLFTYIVTSLQLALNYPSEFGGVLSSFAKFLGVFAVTQIPLAIIEGILTVIILSQLETYAKSELTDLGYLEGGELYEK